MHSVDYLGRGELSERQQRLGQHLSELVRFEVPCLCLCRAVGYLHRIPVICTDQPPSIRL